MHQAPNDGSWGLSALGKAGQITLELLESCPPAKEAWEISVEVPSMDIRFRIPSVGTISEIADFLKRNYGLTNSRKAGPDNSMGLPADTILYSMVDELEVDIPDGGLFRICKDGEFPDRFTMSISGQSYRVGFDLHDLWVKDLIAAFGDLLEDISLQ